MERTTQVLLGLGVTITMWVFLFENERRYEPGIVIIISEEVLMFLMLVGPWVLLLILYSKKIKSIAIFAAAVPMLVSELFAYYTTVINSEGSTAALIYAVKPFFQLILFIPFGLLIGKAYKNRSSNNT